MSRLKRTLAFALALIFVLIVFPPLPQEALAETDGMVRVKLTRLGSPTSITFTTSTAYYIDNDSSRKIASGTVVTVTLSGGKLTLKGGSETISDSEITINRAKAGTGGVKFTSPALANIFCGDLTFSISSSVIMVVLRTYVEDYLYGVVGYEMSNSYPLEALKAQAIAARNYVLRMRSARTSKAYDVVDNSNDQVFKGYNSSYENVIAAVDATRGMLWATTAIWRRVSTARPTVGRPSPRKTRGARLWPTASSRTTPTTWKAARPPSPSRSQRI